MLKKILTISLCSMGLLMSACNTQTTLNKVEIANNNNVYVADVGNGKIGASFSTKITFKEGFNVKANVNGTPAKINSDIAKVDAYLVELTSAPAVGSDPLAGLVTGGSVLNIVKTGASFSILFRNVPPNTAGKKYFVGLVAKDTAGNVISKNPATDWTGASLNKGLAITSGGGDGTGFITVNASYAVSSVTALTVSLSLLDAIGAQVDSTATVTNGGLPPAITAI